MKLIFSCLLLIFLSPISHGQKAMDQSMDFTAADITIADALQKLSEQSGLPFSFSPNFFDASQKINKQWKGQSLEKILEELLTESQIVWKMNNGRIVFFKSRAKKLTISGFIEDQNSGERLIAATVYSIAHGVGTISNEYGFYSLTIPPGETNLQFSYLGYAPQNIAIDLQDNEQFTQGLYTENDLPAIVVAPTTADHSHLFEEHTSEFIDRQSLAFLSGIGGEPDPVRAAQQLPGVNSAVDGLGGLMVRGGDPGQNLMLLDGVPIYIPYHLLGLYSAYNARTVNSAKVMKGSFPARFGGRLSSVFDVRTRDGNKYNFAGEAGANLTTAHALIEGPIVKEKGSFLIAARRSHAEFLLSPALERLYFPDTEGKLEPNFYDFNLKLNARLSAKDKIYLSFFTGNDDFEKYFTEEDEDQVNSSELELKWNNTVGALRWNHLFSDKLFSNTTLTYSWFNFDLAFLETFSGAQEEDDELVFIDSRSNNTDLGAMLDFTYLPNTDHRITFGLGFSSKQFIPDLTYFEEDDEELVDLDDLNLKSLQGLVISPIHQVTEVIGYIEDNLQISDQWHANLGFRSTSFISSSQNFFSVEPRLAIHYHPNEKINIQLAGGQMKQYLHLISQSALSLPNDLWTPASANLLPQNAWQTEINIQGNASQNFNWQIGTYYKQMKNLYAYPDNPDYLNRVNEEELDQYLTKGDGLAYGLEAQASYHSKSFGAQLAVAISETKRRYAEQNLGLQYPFEYDQRLNGNINAYKKFGQNWRLQLDWLFNTGNPKFQFEVLEANLVDPSELNPLGQKNQSRGLPYHRLDLQLSFQLSLPRTKHNFSVGVFNAYNQNNVAYYQAEDNGSFQSEPIFSIPILPSLSYSLKLNTKK